MAWARLSVVGIIKIVVLTEVRRKLISVRACALQVRLPAEPLAFNSSSFFIVFVFVVVVV